MILGTSYLGIRQSLKTAVAKPIVSISLGRKNESKKKKPLNTYLSKETKAKLEKLQEYYNNKPRH